MSEHNHFGEVLSADCPACRPAWLEARNRQLEAEIAAIRQRAEAAESELTRLRGVVDRCGCDCHQSGRDHEVMRQRISELTQRAEAAEAGAAACRHALERFAAQEDALNWGCGLEEPSAAYVMGKAALRSDAGRELLEQLRKAEAERDRLTHNATVCLNGLGVKLVGSDPVYSLVCLANHLYAERNEFITKNESFRKRYWEQASELKKLRSSSAMAQSRLMDAVDDQAEKLRTERDAAIADRDRLAARVGVLESQLATERGGKPCPLEVTP